MAAKLTPAQRSEYGAYAWTLSLRGTSAPKIAEQISIKFDHAITEKTVDRLLAAESKKNFAAMTDDREQARARFIAEQQALYAESWRRAAQRGITSTAAAQHLRNAGTFSDRTAKALGVFVEQVDLTSQGEPLVCRYIGVDVDQV